MLTDTKLKSLKPKDKVYKVTDRDGLYVSVSVAGTVTFRYDYRINGRRETLTIGKYDADGINFAEDLERLMVTRKQGHLPLVKNVLNAIKFVILIAFTCC
ncbi:hypothetical protein RO21_10025 [[Actinobacillus] muris]|uniref:Integrase DNA-binding domain-containing protein n=1 Tax=Muribacter muris TaxID=67855 RepID=A0A0J5P2P6_9PAST|nr:Arm DNA-binding domain-containing protein [Muribacter muris]KMK50758.1 hypothetical protein RO21_10025 [[Actinobacillus] muris] [Muribacter muris]